MKPSVFISVLLAVIWLPFQSCTSDKNDTGTDTGSDTGTGSGTSTDTGSDTGTGSDTSTDTGSDTGTGSGTSTDTGSDTGTGSDTSTDTGSDTGTGSDTVTGTDTDLDTDTAVMHIIGEYTNSTVPSLPGDEPTACEWNWTVRMLTYNPGAVTPRRMYFSSCNTKLDTPDMFTSLAVGPDAEHPTPDPTSGAIIQSRLNESTGKLEQVASSYFPECRSMHGIAVSSDCQTIGALCRIPRDTPGADADPLSEHPDADWMTNASICGDDKLNDEMWLYEWTNGDITTAPTRYIVHKSIGSWEYGNNYLVYGEEDNTYGIAVKATVGDSGSCHEADAYLILDESDNSLTTRAWSWACGTGHTTFNRPAYSSVTQKYAMLCSTDFNQGEIGGLGAYYFRMEDGPALEFHHLNLKGIRNKGGASSLLPQDGGGYMGLIVGVPGEISPNGYPVEPPTQIGMVRFDEVGNMEGGIRWIVQEENAYVSYPQIVKLREDQYLLGWGVMHRTDGTDDESDASYRIPWEYYIMEVNAQGTPLTAPLLLAGTGWGEQDQMVSLGDGRAAWAYIAEPALTSEGTHPHCNQDSLQFTVYQASP